MKQKKFNFTKRSIEDLPAASDGKRDYYYDTKIRGLGLSITTKGSKSFIVYKKISGIPERITLGRYPDISIENARTLALKTMAKIAQGENPNKEKNKIKSELYFSQLFKEFIEKHSKIHKKPYLVEEDKANYKRYLLPIANKKLSSITRQEIEKLHGLIGKNNGIYAANLMLKLLKSVFNKAIDWGWKEPNPCNGIKKFKERSRERFLQSDELPRFFEALENEINEVLRNFFYICLLTGARCGNVLSMHWKDVNFDQATWYIKETKNGEAHTVTLSKEAIGILKERFKKRINDWVFPSKTSRSGHIEEPKSAWKRVLKRADISDLRIHDLRRTLGSWQAATGANSYIIGKSLGHKTQQATAIYARLNLDPVRTSVAKATEAMFMHWKKE